MVCIYTFVIRRGYAHHLHVCSSVIDMYAKCGAIDVGLGRNYFTLITDEYSLVPRVEYYECMIELLGMHGYMV
jgi:hypothetical protein